MGTVIHNPHDKLFKSAMADSRVAREFFEQHLPANVKAVVDLNTLKLSPNSYVDPALKLSLSDVLYQVSIAGETGFLYLLCEHQSTVDPIMPLRIWQYMVAIWLDYHNQTQNVQLPLIIPLVFYHGERPYHGSRDLRELIQAPAELIDAVLFKPFQLVDTNDLADETLREHYWAGVMAFIMKHIYSRDILVFLKQIMGVLKQLEQGGGADHVVRLLKYCLNTGETIQVETFVELVQESLSAETGAQIMTMAEQLIQRGEQRGLQQGLHQGLLQGEHTALLRLLKRKFTVVPAQYQALIGQADEKTLLEWIDRVVEARTLGEVFGDH